MKNWKEKVEMQSQEREAGQRCEGEVPWAGTCHGDPTGWNSDAL